MTVTATSSGAAGVSVGFLGLGIMGEPMARNLLKSAQFSKVVVWNRTLSKVRRCLCARTSSRNSSVCGAHARLAAGDTRSTYASCTSQCHDATSQTLLPGAPAHHGGVRTPVTHHPLAVRTQCDALVAEGAVRADTPAEVVQQCDITIAMLADPEAALKVCVCV
jgi:3-hydroxyisobutyrate dehydrogenase-like beta-hydroxyacid dehydrogenase